jgi:20S proteasome alpha/beta subunit
LGARLSNGDYVLYRLSLVPPDPVVEIVDEYSAIGTGMSYAYLLLRQQTRALFTAGQKMADSNLDANVWLGAFTINEIKTFDKFTSGNTRVAVIDHNGIVEYTQKQVIEKYEAGTEKLASLAESLGISREVARAIFPEL